tara:strand:- start:8 stop:430 length:423 start_codon:yes stop_codon:yes gene_type:complete
MVKKVMVYIFIYIFIVGCSNGITCDDCYLEVEAPSLETDDNGYYHMNYLSQYNQTFTTLDASTGSINKHQKVVWITNKEIYISGYWTNLINQNSYTDANGIAHSVLSVWEQFIGDTIKVYAGYYDNCNIHHIDSLGVIIN